MMSAVHKMSKEENSSVSWTKDETKKLIELYRARENLWNSSAADYHDRAKKHQSYQEIVDAISHRRDISEIKVKLHKLRSQHSGERNKILRRTRSSGGSYRSKWEFFDSLNFIVDSSTKLAGKFADSLKSIERIEQQKDENTHLHRDKCEVAPQVECPTQNGDTGAPLAPTPSTRRVISSFEPRKLLKIRRKKIKSDVDTEEGAAISACVRLLTKAANSANPDDEFSTFGQYVASELRQMNNKNELVVMQTKIVIQRALMDGMQSIIADFS